MYFTGVPPIYQYAFERRFFIKNLVAFATNILLVCL